MNRDYVSADRETLKLFFISGAVAALLLGILAGAIAYRAGMSASDAVFVGFCVALIIAVIPAVAIMWYTFGAARSILVGRLELETGRNFDKDPRIGNADEPQKNWNSDPREGLFMGSGKPFTLPMSQERLNLMVRDVLRQDNYEFTESVLVGDGKAFTSNAAPFQETKRIFAERGWIGKKGSALCLTLVGADAFYRHENRMRASSPIGASVPNLNEIGA